MRTTLDIDADVLAAARSLAALDGRSLGVVVSELARRGLRPEVGAGRGFPVFDVGAEAPPITSTMVDRALHDT